MRHPILPVLSLFLLCCPLPAYACLNDRDSDTLANEAKKLPDTIRVITGRFERNPPLYYQRRIDRVARELSAHPENLSLYDDIAVAYDRLGNDETAIAWIKKKQARLKGDPKTGPQHEAWYRYYANVGTFHAHHWLKSGAKSSDLAEINLARQEIATAIAIKPDAHFGRETYQLAAIEWIIESQTDSLRTDSFYNYLHDKEKIVYGSGKQVTEKTIEGLCGLIVLGNAWESPDIFGALSGALALHRERKLGYMALLRCEELLAGGHRSLLGNQNGVVTAKWLSHRDALEVTNQKNLDEKYQALRQEAEAWQKARTDYMLVRLQRGQHPDSTPGFWREYHEGPPPNLEIPFWKEAPANVMEFLVHRAPYLLFLIFLSILGVSIYGIDRGLKILATTNSDSKR